MARIMDEGHKETDELLEELEKRIAAEYSQAEKEVEEKLEKFIEDFNRKNAQKLKQVEQGKLSVDEYATWLQGQTAMKSRWSEMVDTLAEDMTKTDQIAKSTALEYMPEVYTINHAYGTFQVEKAAHVDTSYTMYNTAAVENLFKDEFKFYKGAGKLLSEKINTDKTLAWNKRQIQSIMTQSILQGESIPQITKRLRAGTKDAFTAADVNTAGKTAKQIAKAVEKKNQAAAVRNARTMTTCVENAGRSKAYKRAEDMGINLDKEWVATLDDRTRHEHRLLDGEVVPLDEPFEVDGYSIMFPGDPDAAGHLVYNCRCSLAPALKGKTDYSKDLSTRNTKKMGDKTYNEWKNEKAKKTTAATTTTTVKTTEKKVETVKKTEYDRSKNAVATMCEKEKIKHKTVEMLSTPLTDEEIIMKISGGDMTVGSCSSLTYAYIGNKLGYDVTDYRGGASRTFFSKKTVSRIIDASYGEPVVYTLEREAGDMAKILKTMDVELGREFRLSVGSHGAIVKKTEGGWQYLELQSSSVQGWIPFETQRKTMTRTLVKRFGCKTRASKNFKGEIKTTMATMTPVDSYKQDEGLRDILGFINTDANKQVKGLSGYAK